METNRANVTFLVNELLEDKLVREGAQGSQKVRGRKPTFLYLNSQKSLAVAVDIRPSRTYMMITDSIGKQMGEIISFNTSLDPDKFVRDLGVQVRRGLADIAQDATCDGIGIVIPGVLDRKSGIVLHAPPLRPGEQTTLAFTVVAADGRHEVEASGSWELRTAPASITTARLALEPQRVVTRDSGTGKLRVHLDNRGSAYPLSVRLHGTDPEGVVRFGFRPGTLDVPPGGVGWADVRISAPRPDSRERLARPFAVIADDGRGTIEATGTFEQSSGDRRPLWRVVLTVLGALLIAIGCFRDWLVADPDNVLGVSAITRGVGQAIDIAAPANMREAGLLLRALQPVERTLALLFAVLMLFGLTGPTGRLTRVSGLVVVVTTLAAVLFWSSTGFRPDDGALLVGLGGLVGFVGGLCVRR